MGDRANIVIGKRGAEHRIHLYSHWGGASVLASVAHGLRSGRLGDEAYFTRIVFSHMIQRDVLGETGYGISLTIQDNEHPLVCVDPDSGEVWFESEEHEVVSGPVSREAFLTLLDDDLIDDDYGIERVASTIAGREYDPEAD